MSVFNALKAVGNALKVLTVTEAVIEIAESEQATDAARRRRLESSEEQGETMSEEPRGETVVEVIELEARQLVKRVKELLHEGNIRKLTIKDSKGRYMLEVPLTVGVLAGGALALTSPALAMLGTLAGFVTNVTIEIERIAEDDESAAESGDESEPGGS